MISLLVLLEGVAAQCFRWVLQQSTSAPSRLFPTGIELGITRPSGPDRSTRVAREFHQLGGSVRVKDDGLKSLSFAISAVYAKQHETPPIEHVADGQRGGWQQESSMEGSG